MISVKYHNRVAVLALERGVTNALNLELIKELAGVLRKLQLDSKAGGLVLTGSNQKFFSIGFDLPQLIELGRKDFEFFFHTFNQTCMELYTLPKPTAAAITGHATAGGTILALCCDYRFCAEGRKMMGLNEIKLGVPVPYPADCILRQVVGARTARRIVDDGDFYRAEDSYRMGLVDELLPLEKVVPEAIRKIETLGSYPAHTFAQIKRNRVEAIESRVNEALVEKERLFMECWFSDEAQKRLREAAKKF